MVKKSTFKLLLINILLWAAHAYSQEQKIADSLVLIYHQENLPDSSKLILLRELSFHEIRDLKKGLAYAEELIKISERSGNKYYQRIGYFLKGNKLRLMGDLEKALDAYIRSAELSKELKNLKGEGEVYGAIADIYTIAGNFENAIGYYRKAEQTLRNSKGDSISLASVLSNTGDLFRKEKIYDSAIIYFTEARIIFDKLNYQTGIGYSLGNLGMVYASLGNFALAEANMNKAILILEEAQDYYPICDYLLSIADIFLKNGAYAESLNYTLKSLRLAEQFALKQQVSEACLKLSALYETTGKLSEAYYYYKKHINYRDSLNNIELVQKLADQRTDFEVSQKQIEVNLLNQQKRNQKALVLSLGIILFLTFIILFILIRNNQHKRKAFSILNLQKQETELQKEKAEEALNELKLTQKQLIQSAKMASLGELTAGIAHEIKNPLNFVNNFSEVTIELLQELKEEAFQKLPDADKAVAGEIMKDIKENLDKILTHGKRADSIVKGMLQHSGQTTGKKEQTNINVLADEYLRISYQALPAKDKNLISKIYTAFDETIEKIEVVPQDIGRVLVNLYNNAFYAVLKKKEELKDSYEPIINISTKKTGNILSVSVRDNGKGISEKNLDKIFQPFFTTKPAGQGTGLGLSLCHDIIRAHEGEITVESKEGAFAEFTIRLPISKNNGW